MMPKAGFKMTLDDGWVKYEKAIDPKHFNKEMDINMRKATELNSIDMRKTIRKFIQQSKYTPNAELTINFKRGSKPLIGVDTTLFNSITYSVMNSYQSFIGIMKGARNKQGKDMVDIAVILHEGTTIRVTEKMRGLFKFISREQKKKARRAAKSAKAKTKKQPAKPKSKTKKQPKAKTTRKPKPLQGRAQFLMRMARGRPIKEISPKTKTIRIPPRRYIKLPFGDSKTIKRVGNRWAKASQESLNP